MRKQNLLEVCQGYRKRGWNVVPLYNFSKAPSNIEYFNEDFGWLPGWVVFQDRMATEDEVKYWFRNNNVTGLGLITGKISGVVVVDEDSYKADGMRFEFMSPLRAKTGRGGKHHFFKYTEPIKTSGFRKGVNIEIKSDGGFVVLPPTVVWIDDEHTKKGKYEWEAGVPLDALPTITEAQLEKYKRGGWSGDAPVDLHELVGAKLGEQHNSIRTIALKTFGRFKKNEWDIAERFIRNEAAHFDPPHPAKRVEAIIKDCRNFIATHRREEVEQQLDRPTFRPRSMREVGDERIEEKELEKVAPKTGYSDLDSLIIGWVPGHLYTLTGDTNVGKTTIACNLAERIREQGKKVLYFALEPENTVVDYLASVRERKHFRELSYDDIRFEDENIQIYGKQEVTTLEDLLHIVRTSAVRYDLIIVDHVGYFVKEKNNWIQEQSNAVKEFAWLAKQMRTAVLLIAHLRKPPNTKKNAIPTMDDIGGSAAFKQDSTEVLIVHRDRLTKDPKDTRLSLQGVLIVAKTKAGPNGYIDIFFSDKHGRIMTQQEVESEITDMNEKLRVLGFPDRNELSHELKQMTQASKEDKDIDINDVPF